MNTTPIRHSGLQKAVLSLYRSFLRVSNKKEMDNPSSSISNYIKTQFRLKATTIQKRDINKIESLLVKGKRQLEQIQDPEFSGFAVFTPKSK
ncbi:hypothetical protein DDB_G0289475 [Dictyostelium discoideum AX4]|uniref:Succinate dehydrogenase assembly factor 1A, mitochondrial n=1 Tax=Dictyostelium discoideum TaxID=44689 RepID=SDHFA_DICDI|nr:hypothetical protein DDB_G0289475 [Dictyostelium discoideum AX4]Q54HG5.1 RecName: Full=Succinate dehydrogenase assembly factor 1A, mitochondrial; Short=SDH assembly factor 1A; Short=SDHAF1A [Dictyostelium discoideum]EAL62717.1 hypothetical protein DDB_G0289475 [Dictyostelium discoideum AX4]|eukprot:XP_636220.1 hypothetical protein DDB_G0289475 [Dictyostelium discoideum AX4]